MSMASALDLMAMFGMTHYHTTFFAVCSMNIMHNMKISCMHEHFSKCAVHCLE